MLRAEITMSSTSTQARSPERFSKSFPGIHVYREDRLGEGSIVNTTEHSTVAFETYGRSLSTMRSVGESRVLRRLASIGRRIFGRRQSLDELHSPAEQQGFVEFRTSVAEGYGTDRALGNNLEVRDFDELSVINGLVMAKDMSRAVSEMTGNGLICGKEELLRNPWFAPQYVRSEWDHRNALSVDSMARRETWYNTRLIVSPFVEEAVEESGEEKWGHIGYVPHLKRGFVQLFHTLGNGKILTGSLSFDGSNKQRLLEIFNTRLSAEIPEETRTDDWLRYALTGVFTDRQAKEFAIELADMLADSRYSKSSNTVDITDQYGELIQKAFDESYVHACESLVLGRQTRKLRRVIKKLNKHAGAYNLHYQEELQKLRKSHGFDEAAAATLHELLVYSTIEMVRSMHQNGLSSEKAVLLMNGNNDFIGALSEFGATGAEEGRDYFACGLSISPGEQTTTEFSFDEAMAFTSDGGVSIISFQYDPSQQKKRQSIADTLTNAKRKGDCLACPERSTTVHGCGLCTDCNDVWCKEFVDNGVGLSIEQVSKISKKRPKRKRKIETAPIRQNNSAEQKD